MKQTFSLSILLILSLGAQAQTLKESVRGRYGEYQGSSETRICGGKATTTYRDKYGRVTGTSCTGKGAFGKTITVYKDRYGQRTGTSTSRTKGMFSSTTTTVYKDKYGQYAGSSTYRHSGNGGTATYRDKYGQVTRTGKVKGRIPAKSSTYFYGKNSSRSRNK